MNRRGFTQSIAAAVALRPLATLWPSDAGLPRWATPSHPRAGEMEVRQRGVVLSCITEYNLDADVAFGFETETGEQRTVVYNGGISVHLKSANLSGATS